LEILIDFIERVQKVLRDLDKGIKDPKVLHKTEMRKN
jgi:hypothetical protein